MNTVMKGLAVAFGVYGLAAGQVPDQRLEANPGQTLKVNLETGGSIRIRGGAAPAVTVKTRLTGRDADQVRVSVERTGNGVSIVSRYQGGGGNHSGGADLEITVPNRFDAELKTMGGEIKVEDVDGQLRGSTMGGPLNLRGLKGRVELSTMGGSIELVSSQVDGKVSTMGGAVTIKDVVGDVKGSSMGGKVVYDNVQATRSADPGKEVKISTMGGEINVASAPSGANVKTMGGGIHIGSAKGQVKARTMGGDIAINELDGSVIASTMGGDIAVTMVGDPALGKRDVSLESKGGEIRLTLPAGLSMAIDVELQHTRNSSRPYRIESDFPLNIQETPEWSHGLGSSRKTITGKAVIAGGKAKIVIRTINGDVIIKKR